jgi:hypothetical protein
MFNSQLPPLSELPSSGQLVRSTIVAAGVAAALLATVVLPSEYGIDPTGVGRVLNLTQMGEIKAQLAQEAAADRVAGSQPAEVQATAMKTEAAAQSDGEPQVSPSTTRSDQLEVVLEPGEAAEVKVAANKGARIGFDWSVHGGVVNYDTHADAPGIDYHGYGKGKQSAGEAGALVAAFDGKHGWFWRNRGESPVTITLRTEGAYTQIKRVV